MKLGCEKRHSRWLLNAQVVLKLKDTEDHKRTPTCAKVAISRDGSRPKTLCGFRRKSSSHHLEMRLVVIIPVAVEKVFVNAN